MGASIEFPSGDDAAAVRIHQGHVPNVVSVRAGENGDAAFLRRKIVIIGIEEKRAARPVLIQEKRARILSAALPTPNH